MMLLKKRVTTEYTENTEKEKAKEKLIDNDYFNSF
jgi:hypothetical protein